MNTSKESWFCVACRVRLEEVVCNQFSRRLGVSVFLPKVPGTIKRGSRKYDVLVPMFPGYLFAKMELLTSLATIRYIEGVRDVVRFGNHVPIVPEDVIRSLEELVRDPSKLIVRQEFKKGTLVTVTSGAFAGFMGAVLRTDSRKKRVQLLIEMLGQSACLEVGSEAIRTVR